MHYCHGNSNDQDLAQGFFGVMILANFVVNIAETMLEEEVP